MTDDRVRFEPCDVFVGSDVDEFDPRCARCGWLRGDHVSDERGDKYQRALEGLLLLADALGEMHSEAVDTAPITGWMVFGKQLEAIRAYVLAHRDTEMGAGARRPDMHLRAVDEVTAYLAQRGMLNTRERRLS